MGTVLAFKAPTRDVAAGLAPEKVAGHRDVLMQFCESTEFPAEQRIDPEFAMATFDKEGHETLKSLFNFFGVTELDPSGSDFETVLNTWFVLTAEVGQDLRALRQFPDTVYKIDAPDWSPLYRAYVEALWNGEVTAVRTGAIALNIARGVVEGSASLRKGPLAV